MTESNDLEQFKADILQWRISHKEEYIRFAR
jgi:hypothetical protein